MISAKHNGNANVMAAAWVSLVGINKVMAYISPRLTPVDWWKKVVCLPYRYP